MRHVLDLLSPRRFVAGLLITAALVPIATAETLVVANKSDATASLVDLDSGEVVATLPTGHGPHEVAISPDGKRAVITDYGTREQPGSSLTVLDVAAAEVVKTIALEGYSRPHGAVFLEPDRLAVTAEDQKAVLVVDLDAGTIERAIDTGQEVSHMLAVDGSRAFVANIGSGSISVLDLAKGERVSIVPTGEGAEGVAVAGGRVWVTNRAADTVTVLDAATLEKVADVPSKGFPIRATATPNGERVLVTHARAGDLAIFDAGDPGQVERVALGMTMKDAENRLFGDRFGDSSVPIGVVTDRAGSRAWIAHANADVITEHDLESGERVRVLRAGREPDGMGFSPVTVSPR